LGRAINIEQVYATRHPVSIANHYLTPLHALRLLMTADRHTYPPPSASFRLMAGTRQVLTYRRHKATSAWLSTQVLGEGVRGLCWLAH
jgi:hypothetical protein